MQTVYTGADNCLFELTFVFRQHGNSFTDVIGYECRLCRRKLTPGGEDDQRYTNTQCACTVAIYVVTPRGYKNDTRLQKITNRKHNIFQSARHGNSNVGGIVPSESVRPVEPIIHRGRSTSTPRPMKCTVVYYS